MYTLNNNKIIKLQFNNQIRRFRVEETINFAQFDQLLQAILQTNLKEYQLCYIDESGDEILFSSDIELSSALSSPSPLRLFLKQINNDDDDNNNNDINNLNNNNEGRNEDKKSTEEIKQKISEINDKIKSIKDEMQQIKQQKKDKKGGESDIENSEKDQKMTLFKHSLSIYELKSTRRSLHQQMKSFNRGNQKVNENGEKNKLRKSIWELDEKAKGIQVQIRSIKLLLNENNSDQQQSNLQEQLCELKRQLFQLKEEKINFCSQFRNNNMKNNAKGMEKRRENSYKSHLFHNHEGEEMKEDFIEKRKQIITLRKRIVEIKSTTNFRNNEQLLAEIHSLKDQIQSLKAKKCNPSQSHFNSQFPTYPHPRSQSHSNLQHRFHTHPHARFHTHVHSHVHPQHPIGCMGKHMVIHKK